MYEWLKAFHIIAIISWMAGLLYLPRLMVYHCEVETGSEADKRFQVMERRLLKAIMTPAMIVSWGLGLWVAYVLSGGDFDLGVWFHIKLALVIGLTVSHFMMAGQVRKFAEGRNLHSARYFRFFNEVPTLLMIAIVILVVVKPFA